MVDAKLFRHLYADTQPIAIIGAGCRFAGARNPFSFWRRIADGEEFTRRVEAEDLRRAGLDPGLLDRPGFVPVASVVEEVENFDADWFGYSPAEAASIDPQQRLFLTCAWEALDMAGLGATARGQRIGVFGAARMSTYALPRREDVLEVMAPRTFQRLIGNDKDYLASRVAYKLGLSGPAVTVQTACSSSLVAIHMACEQLRSGECDLALAGGAALTFPMAVGYMHRAGMIFSPDGRCRPFDADAAGTFIGNGVGVVLLKPLLHALEDGDPVIAVIRGSAVNNDGGDKAGYTAPSLGGQQAVIEEAIALSGVSPQQIGFVEAHGTATPLGDPIEVEALARVFAASGYARDACALGSVKANAGHLDTAAGVASLLKAAFAVRCGQIPPCVHFRSPNPALRLDETPFYVPQALLPWKGERRLAGVSSFGIGGTNCHVVVEALRPELQPPDTHDEGVPLLVISARDEKALREMAAVHADVLLDHPPGEGLSAYCATVAHHRTIMPHRLAVAGATLNDVIARLHDVASLGRQAPSLDVTAGDGCMVWTAGGAEQAGRCLREAAPLLDDVIPPPRQRVLAPGALLLGQRHVEDDAGNAGAGRSDATWRTVLEAAAAAAIRCADEHDWSGLAEEAVAVRELHAIHVGQAMADLAVFPDTQTYLTADEVVERGGIRQCHRQLVQRLLRDLADEGVLTCANGRYGGLQLRAAAAADVLAEMRARGYGRLADLVARTGSHLAAMLRGDADPVSIVFPSGAMNDVEEMYERQRDSLYLNGIAAEAVAAFVAATAPKAEIRVLEIGAGTGGTTGALLPALPRSRCSYTFTDVGPLFLRRAETKFAAYPFLRYVTFDVERDAAEQGLAEASFDLIVAANVIHNVRDLRAAFRRVRELLAPGGILLLRELTEPKPLFDFVFGPLAPEIADLESRGGEFFPTLARWGEALADAGFVAWEAAPDAGLATNGIGEKIILARAPGERTAVVLPPVQRETPSRPLDAAGLLEELVQRHGSGHWRLEGVAFAPEPGIEAAQWRDGENELALVAAPSGDVLLSGRRSGNVRQAPPRLERSRARKVDGEPRQVLAAALDAFKLNGAFHARSVVGAGAWRGGRHWLMGEENDGGVDVAVFDDAGWPLLRLETARPASDVAAASPALYRPAWRRARDEDFPAAAARDPDRLIAPARDGSPLATIFGKAVERDLAWMASGGPAGEQIVIDLTQRSPHAVAELYAEIAATLDAAARAGARVTVVTSGASAVAPWDAVPHPELAGVPALLRVAGRERPGLTWRWIDVDEPCYPAASWRAWLGSDADEDAVAIRSGQVFTRRLVRLPATASCVRVNPEGIHLLTGGLSPLALATAGWLVAEGARQVWLVARRKPDAGEERRIAALRASGATIRLWSDVDVTDRASLETVLKAAAADPAPLAGVFHLAGVLQDGPIAALGAKQLSAVLAPKWEGARTLLSWLSRLKPDFMVLYSSAATVFGPPGQGAHAVANAMLEGLAEQARTQGLPVQTLAWGFWDEGRNDRAVLADGLRRQGMLGMAPGSAFSLLRQALASDAAVLAPMSVDWQRLSEQAGATPSRFLAQLLGPISKSPSASGPQDIEGRLRAILAALLKTDPAGIDRDANLVRLGLDSLMFLEFSHKLKADLGIEVSAETALECDTLAKLVAHLEPMAAGSNTGNPDDVLPTLRRELAALLRRPEHELDPTRNLVQLGLDSLMFLELSARVAALLGVTISAETALRHDTLAKLADAIAAQRSGRRPHASPIREALTELAATDRSLLLPNGDWRPAAAPDAEDFTLSPLQRAWWRGRRDGPVLGGVARHLYVEYDKSTEAFDIDHFEAAWNRLVARHPGLRATIDGNGDVRVLGERPYYPIVREDLRDLAAAQREARLIRIRERMSGQRLDLSTWPHFELRASLIDAERFRLHLDIDTTLVDIESFQVMLHELGALVRAPERPLPALSFTPADYRRGLSRIETTHIHAVHVDGAKRRAAALAGPPDVPLAADPAALAAVRFQNRRESLPRVQWLALRDGARSRGVSPTALVLTAYATVLAPWCGGARSRFTLQLSCFDRKPLHAEVMNLVCDASASLPVELDLHGEPSFADLARAAQAQIDAGLSHETCDGFAMLAATRHGRRFPDTPSLALPVVFTSLLGVRNAYAVPETADPLLGMPSFEYAAQPQVALNFQALEEESELLFNLDWVDGLFPDLMGDALILALASLFRILAATPDSLALPLSRLVPPDPEVDALRARTPVSLLTWLEGGGA